MTAYLQRPKTSRRRRPSRNGSNPPGVKAGAALATAGAQRARCPERLPYVAVSTVKPYCAKSRSKVKAKRISKRSITAKLMASAKEKFLSSY
jgi:hypothetical protein